MLWLSVFFVFSSRFRGQSTVTNFGKVIVTPAFRFPYHCAGVQHNKWIIYLSPRTRSQANIKRKIYWEILFKSIILNLIITSQGTCLHHNKMICRVKTLVCMVKVTGHSNNSLNIHNHRPIKKSVHHDKTMCHICPGRRSQFIFAVENLPPDYNLQSLLPIIKIILALSINVHHNKTVCCIKTLRYYVLSRGHSHVQTENVCTMHMHN